MPVGKRCGNCNNIFCTIGGVVKHCSVKCRFESKFIKKGENECWLWTDYLNNGGYGQFRCEDRIEKAHRFSYELYNNKKIKDGMCILHKCHTPSCINPNHLREGTHNDNMMDMRNANRQPPSRKNFPGNNPILTEKEVEVIKIRLTEHSTLEQLALDYGVAQRTIRDIRSCISWKHVLPNLQEDLQSLNKHEKEEISNIKKYIRENDCSQKIIADLFDRSQTFISMLKNNKIKKWVDV